MEKSVYRVWIRLERESFNGYLLRDTVEKEVEASSQEEALKNVVETIDQSIYTVLNTSVTRC